MKSKKLTSLLLTLLLIVSLLVPVSAASPFSDLPTTHWAYAAAQKAFSDQVVNGTYYNETTGERHFSPRDTVNIAQFVTVVARACYPNDINSATNKDPWYAPGMEVAEKYGLMDGCGNVTVNDIASRYLMSVILYNVMENKGASLPNDSDLAQMPDIIGDWSAIPEAYKTPVATVFHLGIIRGVDDNGTFAGNDKITRDQLVMIYCRLMQNMDPSFNIDDIDISDVPVYKEASTGNTEFSYYDVPSYTGQLYVAVHGNTPYFADNELTTNSYETYAPLDSLGRCVGACASLGRDLMPTQERGEISSVHPSGWQNENFGDGWINNRCHLIGHQLSGEDANVRNLITGTRTFNVKGMLPFESMTADYIKETSNHVMYRVTPVYQDNNLVASGVLMEGYSVEDHGDGIEYCVYVYNVEPDVTIDYATGDLYYDGIPSEPDVQGPGYDDGTSDGTTDGITYILNTNSHKFHYPSCPSVDRMAEHNKQEFTGSRDEVIAMGYEPCKNCNP